MIRRLVPHFFRPMPRSWLFAAVVLGVLSLGFAGCSGRSSRLQRFEYSKPQMGGPFRIVLYADSSARADRAAEEAFARVEALNAMLSDYEYDSELSALSRTGGSGSNVPVSAELWFVLEQAQRLAEKTRGAFDVTVGPFTGLWRKARREHKLPSPERLAEIRESVGHSWLRLNPRAKTVRLERSAMRLDLGGIAKGYAADEALAVLRRHGIARALVAAAGDIALGEPPPDRFGWSVAVAAIDAPDAPPTIHLSLKRCGVSTSGDLFQAVEIDGVRYSHIVDPRTGLGLTNQSLVTVIARNATAADSLATAISVLGPDQGMDFAESENGVFCDVLWRSDGSTMRMATKNFSRLSRVAETPGNR